MNIKKSQFLALLIAIGIIMLFIFGAKEDYVPATKIVNEYDQVLVKNQKSNHIKKSIISTLELIAYKEWALDSVILIKKKYDSMDSVFIQRLEDIKFEFGYSEMLKKVSQKKGVRLDSINVKKPELNLDLEKLLIKHELDSLIDVLSFHRKSLDTLRSLSRHKFYLNQPRFSQ